MIEIETLFRDSEFFYFFFNFIQLVEIDFRRNVCGDAGFQLDFVESSDINRLNEIFEGFNFLGQFFGGDFVVFDDTHDLQFIDAIADRYQF